MSTLGEKLAKQIKIVDGISSATTLDTTTFKAKLFLVKLKVNVDWTIKTRSPSLTFLVGDDTASKLDVTTIGKGEWTEVGSG